MIVDDRLSWAAFVQVQDALHAVEELDFGFAQAR
jgi:hypothetical protein